MDTRKNWLYFGLLFVTCCLVAWNAASFSGNDGDAYWQNKHWNSILLDAVQSALHYPIGADGQPVQPVPERASATVSFVYSDGRISEPRIIKSSGRSDLDAAFLSQLVTSQPPQASGSHAAEPHTFKFVLMMRTPMQDFEAAVCKAIEAKWLWPKDFILAGEVGPTTIEFMYFNGRR